MPHLAPHALRLADLPAVLVRGWGIFRRIAAPSLILGGSIALISTALLLLPFALGLPALALILAGGIALVAPLFLPLFFALHQAQARGEKSGLGQALASYRRMGAGFWALAGACGFLVLVWVTDAGILYAFLVGAGTSTMSAAPDLTLAGAPGGGLPDGNLLGGNLPGGASLDGGLPDRTLLNATLPGGSLPGGDLAAYWHLPGLRTFVGWATFMGAFLAAGVHLIAAFSLPLLQEGRATVVPAIHASVRTLFLNPAPALIWGLVIVLGLLIGLLLPPLQALIAPVLAYSQFELYRLAFPPAPELAAHHRP